MKRDFKRCFVLLRSHAIAVVVSLLVSIPAIALIRSDIVLTAIMMVLYLSAMYYSGWNEGFRDAKNMGESVPDIPRAIKVVLMSVVLPVLLLICRVAAYHMCVNNGQEMSVFLRITDMVYRIYHFYFTGMMTKGTLISYVIPILIPIVIYPIGYAVGLKRFDFGEKYLSKLIYKKKNDTKNK